MRGFSLQLCGALPDGGRISLAQHLAAARRDRTAFGGHNFVEGLSDCVGKGLGRFPAGARFFRQTLVDHGCDWPRHRWRNAAQRRRRLGHVADQNRVRCALEGESIAQRMESDHAQRIHITARVERVVARLLGAHVVHGAEHAAVGSQTGIGRTQVARDTEIGDDGTATFTIDQNIVRLHIAVDHAPGVCVRERPGRLAQDAHHVSHGQRTTLANAIAE